MSDAKRAGENAESKPLNLRLPHAVSDQLQALATSLPIVSKHRLAVEALRLGLAALAADPSILLALRARAGGGDAIHEALLAALRARPVAG
jgi:hypothetical protein